jgi:phosphohistidine phosphatase SixA
MRVMRRAGAFIHRAIVIVMFLLTFSACGAPHAGADGDAALWAHLRDGRGIVVLLRHAQTVPGTGDPPGFRLDDCATQRNLSDAGLAQARQTGGRFRAQRVGIHAVRSSEYCRCRDTAVALGLGAVTPEPMLNSFFADRSTAAAQTAAVMQAIQAHRGQAGVLLMVTHLVNIAAVSGVSPGQGDAVVVRATAAGTLDVLGQLSFPVPGEDRGAPPAWQRGDGPMAWLNS